MPADNSIKLVIIDDHAIVREGVKSALRTDAAITIVAEGRTGREAIQLSRQVDFDVMLLDLALSDKNGIEVLKQIRSEKPRAIVLIFSIHREDEYAIRALKAGAAGYLHKQCELTQIQDAIHQVARGMKYVSAELAQALANQVHSGFEDSPHKALSDREYQTLTMIASGKSVSDIAKELSLSVKTISEYRARILSKMKMRHNAEITHYAIKNQLVE